MQSTIGSCSDFDFANIISNILYVKKNEIIRVKVTIVKNWIVEIETADGREFYACNCAEADCFSASKRFADLYSSERSNKNKKKKIKE